MLQEDAAALLVEAVSHGIRGEKLRWEKLPAARWEALLRLAQEQKLLPILADAIWESPAAEAEAAFSACRQAARRQVMLQAQKDAAFLPIYGRLRQAGIPALVVKGSVCRTVYPNGALRISADEDLLVEPERFAAACSLLSEAGLSPTPGSDFLRSPEIGWRSTDGLLCIELHRYLFEPDSGPFGLLQSVFQDLFSRARTYPLEGGEALLSLSPHDHLLYLLLHAMKHFIRTGFGLRQICDVGLWAARWKREIDWPLLWRQTESVRAERFSAALFAAAERRLGLELKLPAPWDREAPDPEPLLEDALEGGIYGSATRSREHSARITQDAVAAQRRGKRRSLRTAIFPPGRDLETEYPELKAHPARLPLVWQKRLVRYLKGAAAAADDSPLESVRLGRRRLALLREYGILEEE